MAWKQVVPSTLESDCTVSKTLPCPEQALKKYVQKIVRTRRYKRGLEGAVGVFYLALWNKEDPYGDIRLRNKKPEEHSCYGRESTSTGTPGKARKARKTAVHLLGIQDI
ncbi:RPA-related protein RADX [Manis javanica]|nr:RPA-related protein RADX [Manis javanica]